MTARKPFGVMVLMFAGLMLFLQLLALGDPVGAQLSNDADPHGTPPGWREHAMQFGVTVAMAAAALWMIFGGGRTDDARRTLATRQRYRG